MEPKISTDKNAALKTLILRAWRERWTESDFGIELKQVLPRGVSGDAYGLADIILQQAFTGTSANESVLNYLQYSLSARVVSQAAVVRSICNYKHFDRPNCIIAQLNFLNVIMEDGMTCRYKVEEAKFPGTLVSLVDWFVQIYSAFLNSFKENGDISGDQSRMLDSAAAMIKKVVDCEYLMSMLYVGCLDDTELHMSIVETFTSLKDSLALSQLKLTDDQTKTFQTLDDLVHIDINSLKTVHLESIIDEPITFCLQPLLATEITLRPCKDTSYYVAEMLMIQRLKHLSKTRLFYEILRAGLISLTNTEYTSHDAIWGAFTFFKLPHIIKRIHHLQPTSDETPPIDHIPELVKAFEMIMHDNALLDYLDAKCSCNIIEYLLNDWSKRRLVTDAHAKRFSDERESISVYVLKSDTKQAQSIINFIIRAEVPLEGVLKTLSTDYMKVQESLLDVLGQVLVGNSFDLITSVATVENRLPAFVSRLIQTNENSKQVIGETGKPAMIRATLFDISFLMLTFLVQSYGADVILTKNGDSLFEKWVRKYMVESNNPKNPADMIALCDESIVEELLISLRKPDTQLKNCKISWEGICMNLPALLYHVLIAWEKETLTSADVKCILDNIKRRLFAFSVCATSFLCAYMHSVREKDFLKPLNMIQQFLASPSVEEMCPQEFFKERLGLTFQIIRKLQQDMHPTCNMKTRNMLLSTQNPIAPAPLYAQFNEAWHVVMNEGWLYISSSQTLQSLMEAGGPTWMVKQLVQEIVNCKFPSDMNRAMDIAFATLHLDIERNTEVLLKAVVPEIVQNKGGFGIYQPQTLALARLCVFCIISSLETSQYYNYNFFSAQKKRARSLDPEDAEGAHSSSKIRKIATTSVDNSDNSCSVDSMFETQHSLPNGSSIGFAAVSGAGANMDYTAPNITLREPLLSSIQYIFKVFQQFLNTDEFSPKTIFIYQFVCFLAEYGEGRVGPILKLIPPHFLRKILKIVLNKEINEGLVCRLSDLESSAGRQAAISNITLCRNMKLIYSHSDV